MICVYPANCTDFSNNGFGAVTPMSCIVTETLNGEWELTLVHDIDERGKWTRLSEGCILRAPVPAAMTPSVDLVTQQYQASTYDVQIYKITTKSGALHLRSGTGTNYKILGKYKKGREVIVLNKTTSSWYEVTAPDGKHGYIPCCFSFRLLSIFIPLSLVFSGFLLLIYSTFDSFFLPSFL